MVDLSLHQSPIQEAPEPINQTENFRLQQNQPISSTKGVHKGYLDRAQSSTKMNPAPWGQPLL